jgi:hypothetical protein
MGRGEGRESRCAFSCSAEEGKDAGFGLRKLGIEFGRRGSELKPWGWNWSPLIATMMARTKRVISVKATRRP